ncbi:MAG: hypothetical protein HY692_00660 [Cyanobacteria bacterium NC_groundwater_1444_Ag_S-0.65um_54_12]|nr:hypothetical protein [Cyanobacteria bacterium NC_groundwater_1444_Ag_S-0.65um_54_12]
MLDRRLEDLPGYELIAEGLTDIAAKVESTSALLIAIGAPRLRYLGLPVPYEAEQPVDPELRLYRLLGQQSGYDAYSRYNSLIRRLVRFERALEHRLARARSSFR